MKHTELIKAAEALRSAVKRVDMAQCPKEVRDAIEKLVEQLEVLDAIKKLLKSLK